MGLGALGQSDDRKAALTNAARNLVRGVNGTTNSALLSRYRDRADELLAELASYGRFEANDWVGCVTCWDDSQTIRSNLQLARANAIRKLEGRATLRNSQPVRRVDTGTEFAREVPGAVAARSKTIAQGISTFTENVGQAAGKAADALSSMPKWVWGAALIAAGGAYVYGSSK
jgi:hypothetical protein